VHFSQPVAAAAELPERSRLNTAPQAKTITTPPLLESEKDRLPDNSIVEVRFQRFHQLSKKYAHGNPPPDIATIDG